MPVDKFCMVVYIYFFPFHYPQNRYDTVTLLFSGIVGFAQYCAANTDAEGTMKIVKMLNELYTIFDALCDTKRIPNIYKVSKTKRMLIILYT